MNIIIFEGSSHDFNTRNQPNNARPTPDFNNTPINQRTPENNTDNSKNVKNIPYIIIALISYLFLLGILIKLYCERNSENDKFELIYYMSKILTVKSIIIDNHYSELLDNFSPSGEPKTLSYTYRNLLKLVKDKSECITGYRPCGILDTYGNVLCIEEYIPCPINRMRVVHTNIASDYLSQNYKTSPLTNISNNYQFFYSNEFNDGNGVTIIIKTRDEPKFINMNNFVLDAETYEKIFGDEEYLKEIGDVFGIGEKEEIKDENIVVETVTKIFQQVKDLSEELSEMSLQLKGAKLLIKILLYAYSDRIERFEKFVKDKIQIFDENNKDIYYEHIGDNFYSKNFIGFRSVQDIDKFLRFDFSIYKNIFPNILCAIFALVGIIIISVIILLTIIFIFIKEPIKICDKFDLYKLFLVISSILFYVTAFGFLVYAGIIYKNVNKNEELDTLKSVQSDEFINKLIYEFIDKCQKINLIRSIFAIILISIVFNAISLITFCLKKETNSFCLGF